MGSTRGVNQLKHRKGRFLKKSRMFFQSSFLSNFSPGGVVFYALLATIFLAVIAYGTVDQWFKAAFVLMVSFLAAFRLIHGFLKNETLFRDPALLFPLFGILIWAAVQIIPLPPAGEETISVDPFYTADFFILFAGLLAAFEMLLFYTTTRNRLRALIILVIAVGVGSALFGILRQFLPDIGLNFISSYFNPEIGYAQFINRNHFAFLMEMSVGLLMGILLKGRLSEGRRFAGWVATGILIFASISVNSRGGIMSLAGLTILAFFLHFLTKNNALFRRGGGETGQTRKIRLAKTFAAAAGSALLVFGISVFIPAFVGGDAVASRMSRISQEMNLVESRGVSRADIWNSTWELIREKPITGSGFGAYGVAITRFDQTGGKFSLQQAHNDYLEILANGGVVTMLLVIVFAFLVLKKSLTAFGSGDHFRRSACFGALLGICGVFLHSVADFGLHVVGNALVFFVLIVIAVARIKPPRKKQKQDEPSGTDNNNSDWYYSRKLNY